MSTNGDDPFDSLLSLEDKFYKEGYDLGISDGNRAGLIEGRLFGLEKGFEKYATLGKSYGRAVIWTGRLPILQDAPVSGRRETSTLETSVKSLPVQEGLQLEVEGLRERTRVPKLPANVRLEKHIRILYALTEPESLSTDNDENSVSDLDDRFNRAEGKIKVIKKMTRETGSQEIIEQSPSQSSGLMPRDGRVRKGVGGIEDIST